MIENYDVVCMEYLSLSDSRFSRMINTDPVFKLVGQDKSTDERGFLHVQLSLAEALWLAKSLNRHGIQAVPVKEVYRHAGIGLDVARGVAQKYVDTINNERNGADFSNVEELPLPWAISNIAYGFIAKSKKMLIEGISPAGITVCIDRTSSEVLTSRNLLNIELMKMLID